MRRETHVGMRERLRRWIARLFAWDGSGAGGSGRSRGERRRTMRLERCEAREVFALDVDGFSPWRNPDVAADVVPDGVVVPEDLLRVANALTAGGERELFGAPLTSLDGSADDVAFFDVTGDGWLTYADFDAVLTVLDRQAAGNSPAMSGGTTALLGESSGDDSLAPSLFAPATFEPSAVLADGWEADQPEAISSTNSPSSGDSSAPMAAAGDSTSGLAGVASGDGTSGDGTSGEAGPDETLSVTAPWGGTGAMGGGDGMFVSWTGADSAADATTPVALGCENVPVNAGPIPTFILDGALNSHPANWRPKWDPYKDLANEGLLIDDFDSPYIAPGNWQSYTDDESKIAPKWADIPWVDDSHFAWLEIVGVRSYYVLTHVGTLSNDTPVPESQSYEQTMTWTAGASVSSTIGVQIGAELGARLEGVDAKLQALTNGSLTVSHDWETTVTEKRTITEHVPACSVVGLYKATFVVEVKLDYAFMYDTATGPMYGYEREMGTMTLRSHTPAGYRTMLASGTIVGAGGVASADANVLPTPAAGDV